MTQLAGRRIVLGVSGGIAAYKAVELCRRLTDSGAYVSPVLTKNATRFIGAATFDALASEPALTDMWTADDPSPHTKLGQAADLIVVAPATARILASFALGLSDDLLATTLLATRAPVIVCPAMHTEMWEQPSVQHNVELLRQRGVTVIDPAEGPLAGGDQGVGRLADINDIVAACIKDLEGAGDFQGVRVLVTAGGTREPIDPVRYIGNRSSGKQGHAIAEVAVTRGADVVLVTASTMKTPTRATTVHVETAAEMHEAVMKYLDESNVVIMAAAVADFRPNSSRDKKVKKAEGPPNLELVPTEDILGEIASRRTDKQVIVGFAAETNDVEMNASAKLEAKKLDLIVANDVTAEGAGFGHDTNATLILDKSGQKYFTGVVEKRTVAAAVLDKVAALLQERSSDQRGTK